MKNKFFIFFLVILFFWLNFFNLKNYYFSYFWEKYFFENLEKSEKYFLNWEKINIAKIYKKQWNFLKTIEFLENFESSSKNEKFWKFYTLWDVYFRFWEKNQEISNLEKSLKNYELAFSEKKDENVKKNIEFVKKIFTSNSWNIEETQEFEANFKNIQENVKNNFNWSFQNFEKKFIEEKDDL